MDKLPDPSHYPTREDIETSQKLFQQQLDRRFTDEKAIIAVQLSERDKRNETELCERDKAVEVLATTLRESIDRGDDSLREHIKNQIDQIKAALLSANELETTRIEGVKTQIVSVHREIDIESKGTQEAVKKAEAANEKRFESVNEFRAQMADQSAMFITRREVEAVLSSNADKISALNDRMNRNEGKGAGINQLAGWIFGGIGLVVGLISIFVWLSNMQPSIERNSEFRQQAAPVLQQQRQQQP